MKKDKVLVIRRVEHIMQIVEKLSNPVEIIKGSFQKLEFCFKNNELSLSHNGVDLKEFKFVWISCFWNTRMTAYALMQYLKHNNIAHTEVEESSSKLTDTISFSQSGIRIPDSYFTDAKNPLEYMEAIEEVCGYPLIVKDLKGFKGKHSELINNKIEFVKKFSALPKDKKYIFQKFIPNDYDWGIIVGNGKILSAEKSYKRKDAFQSNPNKGGSEVFVNIKEVPSEVAEMALKAADALGLAWCRSDIIIDKNTKIPYMLEVNRAPGITGGSTEMNAVSEFLVESLNIETNKQLALQVPV